MSPVPPAPADLDATLLDVEAPSVGGEKVDTPAYAVPPSAEAGRHAPDADGIDVEAPPPQPASTPAPAAPGAPAAGDVLDRAGDALLRLAAARPWRGVSLRDIAAEAGAPFAELYSRAAGKTALLLALSRRMDRSALERIAGDDQPSARDRLFEAMMSRLEVMEPHRAALLSIGRTEGAALAPALPRTARALLEGAGVDTGGGRGALRLAAVTAAWARVLQVWRDDEGALNRTMAEIDKLLARTDARLKRVGAGF